MPPERNTMIAFRAGDLLEPLRDRAGSDTTVHATGKRDLERLYAILPYALRRAAVPPDQAALLLHIYRQAWPNGLSPVEIVHLNTSVEQALWKIRPDGPANELVAHLGMLDETQRLAVVDAIERAVGLVARGDSAGEALQKVGLA